MYFLWWDLIEPSITEEAPKAPKKKPKSKKWVFAPAAQAFRFSIFSKTPNQFSAVWEHQISKKLKTYHRRASQNRVTTPNSPKTELNHLQTEKWSTSVPKIEHRNVCIKRCWLSRLSLQTSERSRRSSNRIRTIPKQRFEPVRTL